MKKSISLAALALVASSILFSCKKNKCAECHYDKNGAEVELGEKCGDDIENLEASGYNDGGTVYEVHCGEH
jgi:hypothetical protein